MESWPISSGGVRYLQTARKDLAHLTPWVRRPGKSGTRPKVYLLRRTNLAARSQQLLSEGPRSHRRKITRSVFDSLPRFTASTASSPHRLAATRRFSVSLSGTGVPSSETITSPTWTPAFSAGVFSETRMTFKAFSPSTGLVERPREG